MASVDLDYHVRRRWLRFAAEVRISSRWLDCNRVERGRVSTITLRQRYWEREAAAAAARIFVARYAQSARRAGWDVRSPVDFVKPEVTR